MSQAAIAAISGLIPTMLMSGAQPASRHEVDCEQLRNCTHSIYSIRIGANRQAGRLGRSEHTKLRNGNSRAAGKQEWSRRQTRRDSWLIDGEPVKFEHSTAGYLAHQRPSLKQERTGRQTAGRQVILDCGRRLA